MSDLRAMLGDRYRATIQAALLADNPGLIEDATRIGGELGQLMYLANVDRMHRTLTAVLPDLRTRLARVEARLARENQAVAVESLSITGLARTRLAKSVHDAGWGILLRLLAEKTTVVAIDRWCPSTRTCSQCGVIGGKKPLHIREWTCPDCGAWLDRDYNAAVNIMVAAGLAETQNACGGDVRPKLMPLALVRLADPSEAGTHRTDRGTRVSAA